ncbi:MAG TPA: DUF4129 domain-containing protein, partial [Crinalium sp.]
EESQTFNALRSFWRWVAGWLPSPVTSWLSRIFGTLAGWLAIALTRLMGLLSQGWVGVFAGLLLVIALGFIGWLLWRGWCSWRYRRWLAKLPPMESLYQQMLHWQALQGFRKRPAQTPLEYAQQAQTVQPLAQSTAIDDISQAYVRWRYGGKPPNLTQLKQRLRDLKRPPTNQRRTTLKHLLNRSTET